ncbi:MAG: preprotein translocase subunit YajC [Acidobacteriota bacterium]
MEQLQAFVPIILISGIFYFLMFRPMRTRQKKLETVISGLKNGDRVITNSGIYGTIAGIKDQTFLLKVSDQVKLEISKNAVAGLQLPENTSELQ